MHILGRDDPESIDLMDQGNGPGLVHDIQAIDQGSELQSSDHGDVPTKMERPLPPVEDDEGQQRPQYGIDGDQQQE
jgi:hypothetical protein